MFLMSVTSDEVRKYYYSRESFTRLRENAQYLTCSKMTNLDKQSQIGIWDLVWIRLKSRPYSAFFPYFCGHW